MSYRSVCAAVFAVLFLSVCTSELWGQWSPDFYVDHWPDTNLFIGDDCHRVGCQCGSILPGGPDYKYSRAPCGRNYDPAHESDPAGAPPQQDHVFRVPCSYRDDPHWDGDDDTLAPYVGCFMLGFTVSTCKDGQQFSALEIRLRDQGKACQNDKVFLNQRDTVGVVTLYDTVIVGKDTLVTSRDSLIYNRDTMYVITYDSTLGSNYPANSVITIPLPVTDTLTSVPCKPMEFMFEVCDLWKWGHFPAEYDCPIVFEVTLKNANPPNPDCGTIPFVIWGDCNGLDVKIEGEGGEPVEGTYVPNIGEVRIIRYEGIQGVELE